MLYAQFLPPFLCLELLEIAIYQDIIKSSSKNVSMCLCILCSDKKHKFGKNKTAVNRRLKIKKKERTGWTF